MEPRLESRGIELHGGLTEPGVEASMEPRLESRGIRFPRPESYEDVMLQWSRGSKAAESSRTPKRLEWV